MADNGRLRDVQWPVATVANGIIWAIFAAELAAVLVVAPRSGFSHSSQPRSRLDEVMETLRQIQADVAELKSQMR